MPYQTAHSRTAAALLAVLRQTAVAGYAGVDPFVWGSLTSPRVMLGDRQGYVGGLHRGRLPCVEVFCDDESWTRDSIDQGTIATVWALRVHVNGPTAGQADAQARIIIDGTLALLRAEAYLESGGLENVEPLAQSPLGFSTIVRVRVAQTFCRDTYELTLGLLIQSVAPPAVVIPP